MAAIVEGKKLDDVIEWIMHPGFNYMEGSLNSGTNTFVKDALLMGIVALNNGDGTFTLLKSTDAIAATALLSVVLVTKKLKADVAAAANAFLTDVLVLERGPALAVKTQVTFANGVALTTGAINGLLRSGIKLVNETGAVISGY